MPPVCPADVLSLVNNLKSSNAAGFDEISNNFLKKCRFVLCDVLAFIINLCLEKAIFPHKLKVAKVIPLFKKGDTNDYGNYRAISLLSSFSKVLELHMKNSLCSFFLKCELLSTQQHGFTLSRSTESALCDFQNQVVATLDRGLYSLGLFFYFSRAFDFVDHNILLYKLDRCGVRGASLALLKSYLQNRSQRVAIGSEVSKSCLIARGVPQGSILGPFLFLVYANDLISFIEGVSSHIKVISYADDTNILIEGTELDTIVKTAEAVYDNVVLWSEKNRLCLKDKTHFVSFSLGRHNLESVILFRGTQRELLSSSSSKLLGITFDQDLKWHSHVENLCSRLRSGCYALKFLSQHCGRQALLTLYYANFHSFLRYGIVNWGLSPLASRVFLIQKYAIRIISNLKYRDSCRDHFKSSRILTLIGVYIYEISMYVYKNKSYFQTNRPAHQYDTRRRELLLPNAHQTSFYQKNIIYNACKIFNHLSDSILSSPSIFIFKRRLKDFLIEKNCYSLDEFFS